MNLLDEYFTLLAKVHAHFGYVENWRVIPLDDQRECYWHFTGDAVTFAPTSLTMIEDESAVYYENQLYTQRFLDKWVYRADDYTMICVDTRMDGNKFLQVFDNAKEMTIVNGEYQLVTGGKGQ